MKTNIFHTVNAGLYLWSGETGLLIDGLHAGRAQGFSPLPEGVGRALRTHCGLFAHLNALLFTHLHGDHYDRALLLEALRVEVPPLVYGPELSETSVEARPIRPGLWFFHAGQAHVLCLETVHDGEVFRGDPHRSLLVRVNGESIFIAGDALLRPDQAGVLGEYYGEPVAAAFVNLYQLAGEEGLAFLRALAPRRIFLYHEPFPQDDQFCYSVMARQVLRRLPADLPQPERLAQMSWIDGAAPAWNVLRSEGA